MRSSQLREIAARADGRTNFSSRSPAATASCASSRVAPALTIPLEDGSISRLGQPLDVARHHSQPSWIAPYAPLRIDDHHDPLVRLIAARLQPLAHRHPLLVAQRQL